MRTEEEALSQILFDIKERQNMKSPNFRTRLQTTDFVLIEDIGPWEEVPTVTNGVEQVVTHLISIGKVQTGQRLFYVDSDKDISEILFTVVDGFVGFKPMASEDSLAETVSGAWKQILRFNKKISG